MSQANKTSGRGTPAPGEEVWVVNQKKGRDAHPCIWMQAGAVSKKNCNNFYQCNSCKYDLGLKQRVADGKQVSWQDALRRRESAQRTCRHALTGRTGHRICPYHYNCDGCDFDQYLEDVLTSATGTPATAAVNVKGFSVPDGYFFHNGHAWARIESGGLIRIGQDDFSMKLLGEADTIDLPLTGQTVQKGLTGWELNRDGKTAPVLSPVNGIVMDVNPAVRKRPAQVNHDPYGDGWLMTVHVRDIGQEMENLMSDEQGISWIDREADILIGMIEAINGPLATDGGIFVNDIFGHLPALGWHNLTRIFLKA